MNSLPSGSSSDSAFERLDTGIQRWVYREGWTELRDVQGEAILAIAPGGCDVLISAPTAAGKTEAAFLPLLSRALAEEKPGVRILYIGPLKALINDQFARLEGLCEELEVPVYRWHGDVAAMRKERVREHPDGVVLITPESLEALFVNHGPRVARMFAGLEGVIVDEVHSFIGEERGAQLQSLLHRLEVAIGRRVDRIGLSATLGRPELAAEFLRPGGVEGVALVQSRGGAGSLRALIVGIEEPTERTGKDGISQVAEHLFPRMVGANNLVFANSRHRVEELGDKLVQQCELARRPVEFGAHHGSLGKEWRQAVEARLKEGLPFTAVCTSTLEMGIDIGSMASVAQVGAPFSVAALRQRVGRSGRRGGEPPCLWMYALEKPLSKDSVLMERLRVGLFQQCAMLELVAERWCEPPVDRALHLSTLIQQSLSAVGERGGMSPAALYRLLCEGPFSKVDKPTFAALLRDLGARKVLVSAEDGTLLAGEVGERMLAHYSFYSAFSTAEEYRVVCEGRTLGTLPVDRPIHPEGYIVFGAQRWKVLGIDEKAHVIQVRRAKAGKAPLFGGEDPFGIHREVRLRMRDLYASEAVRPYLDPGAERLLAEGRASMAALELRGERWFQDGGETWLFLWDSDWVALTLALALQERGLQAEGDGVALAVEATPDEVFAALEGLAHEMPSLEQLTARVGNKKTQKHDHLLGPELLSLEYASRMLDLEGARRALPGLLGAEPA